MKILKSVTSAVLFWWLELNPKDSLRGELLLVDASLKGLEGRAKQRLEESKFSVGVRIHGASPVHFSFCEPIDQKPAHWLTTSPLSYLTCKGSGWEDGLFKIPFSIDEKTPLVSEVYVEGRAVSHVCDHQQPPSASLTVVGDHQVFSCPTDVSVYSIPVGLSPPVYAVAHKNLFFSRLRMNGISAPVVALVYGDWLSFVTSSSMALENFNAFMWRYKELVFLLSDIKISDFDRSDLEKIVLFLKEHYPGVSVIPPQKLFAYFVARGFKTMMPACDDTACLSGEALKEAVGDVSSQHVVVYGNPKYSSISPTFFQKVVDTFPGHISGFFSTSVVSPELQRAACRAMGESCEPAEGVRRALQQALLADMSDGLGSVFKAALAGTC